MKLPIRYPAVVGTAVVAGVFSLLVSLLLLVDFVGRGSYELFDSPRYLTLKEQLKEAPNDPEIQDAIRQLDLRLRQAYFSHRRFMAHGIYLLIGGVIVCLAASRWAMACKLREPHPQPADESTDLLQHEQQLGRRAALVVVGCLLVLMVGLTWRAQQILPTSVGQLTAAAARSEDIPSPKEGLRTLQGTDSQPTAEVVSAPAALPDYDVYLAQWPRFRGPTGSGGTDLADIPQQWDVANGQGVLWKVPVPLPSPNSPVLWQGKVFLSGATAQEQAIFCFDTNTGELLWQRDVPVNLGDIEEFEVAEYTGYAASTMATDGVRAYAIFASGNLVATDLAGQQLWRVDLGVPKNHYGHASSLATYQDRLIVQYDQGRAKDKISKLMALEGSTGKVVWEVTREVPVSWTTPIVTQIKDRMVVITCTEPWVTAYSADDGKELWRAECMSGELGPSPILDRGVVYAANEACGLFAIRADGEGDVADTHIEWFTDYDVPDVSTPLIVGDHLLMMSHGLLASFELGKADDPEEPREPLWEEDLEEEMSASPSRVGELVYLFSEEGKAWVVKPTADGCERIAETDMGEPVRSSPAFAPGRIYIRGEEHLFCIGK